MIGRHRLKIAVVVAAAITLAGCAAVMTDIVGQGRGTDRIQQPNTTGTRESDLKRSPCACIPVPLIRVGTPLA